MQSKNQNIMTIWNIKCTRANESYTLNKCLDKLLWTLYVLIDELYVRSNVMNADYYIINAQ